MLPTSVTSHTNLNNLDLCTSNLNYFLCYIDALTKTTSFSRIVLGPADPLKNEVGSVLMHPGDEKGGGVVMEIASITIHPKYHPFTFENDVALIKLKEVA